MKVSPTRMQRRRARSRGQALVELALALPMLFVVIFGAVEFGTALYDKAVITNASREGARAGIVATTPRKTNAEITAVVNNYVASHMIAYKPAAAPSTTINPTLVANRTSGVQMTVTVAYTYPFFLIPKFLTAFTGQITLNGATTMRME